MLVANVVGMVAERARAQLRTLRGFARRLGCVIMTTNHTCVGGGQHATNLARAQERTVDQAHQHKRPSKVGWRKR